MARLLIVDDDEALLEMLCDELASQGHQILQTCDPAQALPLARQHLPQLAILDYHMPQLSGTDVLENLRADARTRELPVIFLSSLDPFKIAQKVQAGAHVRFLGKPIDYALLHATIADVLAAGEG